MKKHTPGALGMVFSKRARGAPLDQSKYCVNLFPVLKYLNSTKSKTLADMLKSKCRETGGYSNPFGFANMMDFMEWYIFSVVFRRGKRKRRPQARE